MPITYEFTSGRITSKFITLKNGDVTLDLISVPLELRLPHSLLRNPNSNNLESRIKSAVKEMVDKLNQTL